MSGGGVFSSEQPGAVPPNVDAPGSAGGGLACTAPRAPFIGDNRHGMTSASLGAASLGNVDFAEFTRANGAKPLQRVALAAGAGVCLHRQAGGFMVEIHAHDADGGYLLSLSQAEAARLADRLAMFARLVPGVPVKDGGK